MKFSQILISPYNISLESQILITRLNKMITKERNSWLQNKFSLAAPLEVHREEYEEYAYWCKAVNG